MNLPTFDSGGYPTNETLAAIRVWPVPSDTEGLIQCVIAAWNYPDRIRYRNGWLTMSTGGWSGNESIIAALMDNLMFRVLYWYSSQRGGRYKFKIGRRTFLAYEAGMKAGKSERGVMIVEGLHGKEEADDES